MQTLKLKEGKTIAISVIEKLNPFVGKIEAVGSIRRNKPEIHDVDILLIPNGNLSMVYENMNDLDYNCIVQGIKTARFIARENKVVGDYFIGCPQVDLYFATSENYEMLRFVRTGSKEHNIKIAYLAKRKGWHINFDGEGLFDKDNIRIAGDTEESIFQALELPYKNPEERQ